MRNDRESISDSPVFYRTKYYKDITDISETQGIILDKDVESIYALPPNELADLCATRQISYVRQT